MACPGRGCCAARRLSAVGAAQGGTARRRPAAGPERGRVRMRRSAGQDAELQGAVQARAQRGASARPAAPVRRAAVDLAAHCQTGARMRAAAPGGRWCRRQRGGAVHRAGRQPACPAVVRAGAGRRPSCSMVPRAGQGSLCRGVSEAVTRGGAACAMPRSRGAGHRRQAASLSPVEAARMTAPAGAQGASELSEYTDASLGSTLPQLLYDTFKDLVRCRLPLSLLVRPRLGPRTHAGGARHSLPVWPQRSSGARAAVSGSAAVRGGSIAEGFLSGPHRAAIAASSVACAGRRRGP